MLFQSEVYDMHRWHAYVVLLVIAYGEHVLLASSCVIGTLTELVLSLTYDVRGVK